MGWELEEMERAMEMRADRNGRIDDRDGEDWRGVKASSILDFENQAGLIAGESVTDHLSVLQSPGAAVAGDLMMSSTAAGRSRKKEERIPQWGYRETKEFIAIRAELEKDFTQTKRNKTLWELISGKMKDKGFRRSADQCKCKWKNLVNRYKGKETSDPDNGRQCPFFDELDAIFKERVRNMDRLLLESEHSAKSDKNFKKSKRSLKVNYSDEDSAEEEEEEDTEEERASRRKKRKADRERQRLTAEKYRANSMQEVLEDFFRQQHRLEDQWREAVALREEERRLRESEWREAMEKLEQERIFREQQWRDREEQRRARDEARSQKREEMFAVLITKLAGEEA